MKKVDLIRDIREKTGLDARTIIAVFEALSELVETRSKEGQDTFLPGVGILQIQDKPSRRVRNPRTGELVICKPKRLIKLKPLKRLRDTMNASIQP